MEWMRSGWSLVAQKPTNELLAYLVVVALLAVALRALFAPTQRSANRFPTHSSAANPARVYGPNEYDVIVVGLSIAGCAAAKRLSDQGRKVLVVERELTKPDRIVGELLQPGGIEALQLLGMEDCARIVGQTCTGYVAFAEGQEITLPYAAGHTGCSFHFGDFVTNLRDFVRTRCKDNVTIAHGTALDLVLDPSSNRVLGLKYRPATAPSIPKLVEPDPTPVKKRAAAKQLRSGSPAPVDDQSRRPPPLANGVHREPTDLSMNGHSPTEDEERVIEAKAALVIMCDGSGSNFRRKISRNGDQDFTPHSHFVGLIMKGARLPYETKGHVFLGTTGPFLAYRLDPNEVRLLVDYKGPVLAHNKLPAKEVVQKWLQQVVGPQLPTTLQPAFYNSCKDPDQIRSMPTPFFTQLFPKHKALAAVGDHQNQRHPLTGGGMTCAFRDAIELTGQLAPIADLQSSPQEVQDAIDRYTCVRCRNVGCINILSWALYAVFEGPMAMRRACFHYFFLGGDAVAGPMSMLSGLRSSVPFLLYHYYRVMLYGTYLVMTHDPSVTLNQRESPLLRLYWFATFWVSPWRIWTTAHLLIYSSRVFIPLLFREFLPKGRFSGA